jgi:hypothetical protein
MVARITWGYNLKRTLQYNEQKVAKGIAECLLAVNYLQKAGALTLQDKLHRLTYQAALNENVRANSVHITLNFDRADSLKEATLKAIAKDYMEQIGFGAQPYLLYQHKDSGHPHLHVVTTNIQSNGRRLSLHNLGKVQSQKAIHILEQRFRLTPSKKQKPSLVVQPAATQRIEYGQATTKEAIQSVLNTVLHHYHYTSLSELNAVLKLYNVRADAGSVTSRLHQLRGLYYRMLNDQGQRIGSPIKASAFAGRPTLRFLEQKFQQSKVLKQGKEQRIQVAIEWALLKPRSLSCLVKHLEKEGIHTVLTKNKTGLVEGITFIDQQTKCIFQAEDLGGAYSTEKLQQRCTESLTQKQHPSQKVSLRERLLQTLSKESTLALTLFNKPSHALEKTTHQLLSPVKEESEVPRQLVKQKRKRKRQSFHL